MDVEVSSQFYGWLAGLGSRVQIVSPEDVREEYKKYFDLFDPKDSWRELMNKEVTE